MMVQPYLFFAGRCDEALTFYGKVLGAKVEFLMRFKEAPAGSEPAIPAQWQDKVMHANIVIGSTQIMASDGMCEEDKKDAFSGFSLSVSVKDVAEGEKILTALSDGGKVTMPFQATFWSPGFGMAVDRFGVSWMVAVMV